MGELNGELNESAEMLNQTMSYLKDDLIIHAQKNPYRVPSAPFSKSRQFAIRQAECKDDN